jgi:outer membrane protein insertion porin family
MRRRWSLTSIALVGLLAVSAAACHDEEQIEVSSLTFDGNQSFTKKQLEAVIVTEATGWLPWARKRYFNRGEFEADLKRLQAFYADRGFPSAHISALGIEFNDDNTAVKLRIGIEEGEPTIVQAVEFTGLDALTADARDALQGLPLQAGSRRDRQLLAASRERATFLLRDAGYAHARVSASERSGDSPRQVVITFEVDAGPLTRVGDIAVRGTARVSESVVLRSLAFRPGDLYRESQLIESQRRLRTLGIFDFAHVGVDPELAADTTPVPLVATVSEGRPQRYRFGVGYGSEEGPRGSFEWDHLNFLGDARQFSLETRYSSRLRGLGAELLEPYFLTTRLAANARLGGWWATEPNYTSRSIGGRLGLTFRTAGRLRSLAPVDHVVRVSYVNEALEYTITPEALADQTQFDQLIALGLDPSTGKGSGRLAAIDLDLERTAIDNDVDPHTGHVMTLRLKMAAPWLGGTYRYREVLGEGRIYVPIGASHTWASRARLGAIYSSSAADVPFSQRYFLGGSTNLRGWGRFQVAPLTPDGLPIGGRALVDLTTELRIVVRGNIGAVAFVDAGNVWDESTTIRLRDLHVAVGPGLRYYSPIGVVRADVGYQLDRIDGLVIDGAPERRRWRIHFSIGHAF